MPPNPNKVRLNLQVSKEFSDQIDELVLLLQERRAFSRRAHRNELLLKMLAEAVSKGLEEERARRRSGQS